MANEFKSIDEERGLAHIKPEVEEFFTSMLNYFLQVEEAHALEFPISATNKTDNTVHKYKFYVTLKEDTDETGSNRQSLN